MEWLRKAGPYIQGMMTILKYIKPPLGPWLGVVAADYTKLVADDIRFMNELVKVLPELTESQGLKLSDEIGEVEDPDRVHGSGLCAMRKLLNEKDPYQNWDGLGKVFTPEGNYLWLCEYHAREYR